MEAYKYHENRKGSALKMSDEKKTKKQEMQILEEEGLNKVNGGTKGIDEFRVKRNMKTNHLPRFNSSDDKE